MCVCVYLFFSKLMLLFKINNPESLYASVHFTFTNGRGYKRLFHIKRLRNTCFNVWCHWRQGKHCVSVKFICDTTLGEKETCAIRCWQHCFGILCIPASVALLAKCSISLVNRRLLPPIYVKFWSLIGFTIILRKSQWQIGDDVGGPFQWSSVSRLQCWNRTSPSAHSVEESTAHESLEGR